MPDQQPPRETAPQVVGVLTVLVVPIAVEVGRTHFSTLNAAIAWGASLAFAGVGRAIGNTATDHGRALNATSKVLSAVNALAAFGYLCGKKSAANGNSIAPLVIACVFWAILMAIVYLVMTLNRLAATDPTTATQTTTPN